MFALGGDKDVKLYVSALNFKLISADGLVIFLKIGCIDDDILGFTLGT